jgi:hypothetical protein
LLDGYVYVRATAAAARDRSQGVLEGSIAPDGIDLTCTTAHPSEIFWRQLHSAPATGSAGCRPAARREYLGQCAA